jgi:DNA polymerase III subunit delta'
MLADLDRHPHARAVLGGAVPPEGSPSHAYLFHGPAGSGKRAVARAFAAALLAEGAPDPGNARARVEHGVHPDLTWVAPRSAAGILVGDIDEPVVSAAARTPFESSRRVFVIEAADELNDQAANRMLKTLEEPPAFAHLLLLTSRPGDVLPTIASRCQGVRFDAPGAAEIAARLDGHGIAEEQAQACARLALGDADRALALALGEGPAMRAAAEAFARATLSGELAGCPRVDVGASAKAAGARAQEDVEAAAQAEVELVPKKERRRVEREAAEWAKRAHRRAMAAGLDTSLGLVGLWYRDVACVADGAEELAHHADRLPALREDADGRRAGPLRAAVSLVDEARSSLELNPTEELLLEALAFRAAAALR